MQARCRAVLAVLLYCCVTTSILLSSATSVALAAPRLLGRDRRQALVPHTPKQKPLSCGATTQARPSEGGRAWRLKAAGVHDARALARSKMSFAATRLEASRATSDPPTWTSGCRWQYQHGRGRATSSSRSFPHHGRGLIAVERRPAMLVLPPPWVDVGCWRAQR